MINNIAISDHYAKRFRQRVARTKRIEKFAKDAYMLGEEVDSVADKRFRKYLENIETRYWHTCSLRTHKGYIHVFDALTATAITVYRVPNEYR